MFDEAPVFSSFMMGGFECTAAKGDRNRRLDLLSATRHDTETTADYHLLKTEGIKTVREGFAWSSIDKGTGEYDFSRYHSLLLAGQQENIQQIWDLNHFDYPDFLEVNEPTFVTAFANYARATILELRKYITGTVYVVPMNEISFFAWIGADKGWWAPYQKGRTQGFLFKKQLVKASIAAMDAIWQVTDDVRFIQVDPLMRRVAADSASRHAKRQVNTFNAEVRYEAWDMLNGTVCPELGGDHKYLDIVGINYYVHNQEWIQSGQPNRRLQHQQIEWDSPNRISFAAMLQEIFDRYHRPMIVSETGSFGENRQRWWERTVVEIQDALHRGLPLYGVCAYPTLDRPESAGFLLPHSGIWDFDLQNENYQRIPHQPSLEVIRRFQAIIQSNERYNELLKKR